MHRTKHECEATDSTAKDAKYAKVPDVLGAAKIRLLTRGLNPFGADQPRWLPAKQELR